MNGFEQVQRMRADVPLPRLGDMRREYQALAREIEGSGRGRRATSWRRRQLTLSFACAGGLAAAVAVGVLVVGPTNGRDAQSDPGTAPAVAAPVDLVRTMQLAAHTVAGQRELTPGPNQFLVYKFSDFHQVSGQRPWYFERVLRQDWLPTDGKLVEKGVTQGLRLQRMRYPGEAPPPPLENGGGPDKPMKLLDFDQRAPFLRTDYAYVRTLPTDIAGMRAHLYTQLGQGAQGNREAWHRVGSLLMAYLPPAQRAALFRAVATIPGVTLAKQAKDVTGRTGIAVVRTDPDSGTREEFVLDPTSYRFLGSRLVITKAGTLEAGTAPAGTVIQAFTLLKVTVADHAPDVAGRAPQADPPTS
jgi:hypothetical protein